ncbi:olfactory receptor 225 [Cricetulus griseus]
MVMGRNNDSYPQAFILVGFSDRPRLEMILFAFILVFYALTLVGNTAIIFLSVIDSRLHMPMYFFLGNLSFLDLCFTTSIVPQLLWNLWGPDKSITYHGCAAQLYIYMVLGSTECVLLAVMSYDRYVAVCRPLHYTVVMNPRLCLQLVSVAWCCGFLNSFVMCPQTMQLSRCGHQRVDHFLCEMPALIAMSCEDTMLVEACAFVLGVVLLLVPLSLILLSYGMIAATVLRIKSTAGRRKAFNTCSSHLTVVSLFYGTIIYMYVRSQLMETNNESSWDFILLGFSDRPRLEMVLFVVNMVFYFLAVTGNSTIIFLSLVDLRLHTPMYFFLSNLSLLDLCYTTSSIPQLQVNLWGPRKTISFVGCVIQLFAFLSVGGIECILLSVMAYDRFVAVCKPLHYLTIMHPQLCLKLAAFAWLSGIANSILMSPLTMSLGRCGHRRINHFVCEMPAIIRISCVDTSRVEGLAFFLAIPIVLVPLTMILVSYGYIAAAVLRIKSAAGRRKAFNTCSSHMVVVSLFYSTIIYMYMQPGNVASQDQGKFLTLFYCLVTPTLNPFIYSLRNKDMKAALLKVLGKDRSLLDTGGH